MKTRLSVWIISLLMGLVLWSTASAQSAVITISIDCASKNSVGHEWGIKLLLNDIELQYTDYHKKSNEVYIEDTLILDLEETLHLESAITESDKQPDIGTMIGDYQLSAMEIDEDAYRIIQTVDVRENGGRYSGHVAQWTITLMIRYE